MVKMTVMLCVVVVVVVVVVGVVGIVAMVVVVFDVVEPLRGVCCCSFTAGPYKYIMYLSSSLIFASLHNLYRCDHIYAISIGAFATT